MRFLSTLAASALGTLVALGALLLLLFFFLFAISLSGDTTPTVATNSVLVIDVEGAIPERTADDPFAEAFGDAPAYDLLDLQHGLRRAASDDRIRAVWLRMRSRPSSFATLEEVRSSITAFKETSGKPVIASSEDFAMDERAYYLASAADSVFMSPVTNFALDGFQLQVSFLAGALDKLGIDVEVFRAGDYKSAAEPLVRESFSDPNREQYQALVNTFNDTFKQAVSESRGMSPDEIEQIADEDPILLSDTAIERGLIDGHRYLDEVEDVFRSIMDLGSDAAVPTVNLSSYKRVPDSQANLQFTGEGSVAIVYGEGGIVPGESEEDAFGNTSSLASATFIDAIRQARESSSTKAVVVRVNSGGGSASASEAMWREIRMTADVKPVIFSMGGAAASGGYYMAAGADSIVANATTITGSIGVIGTSFNTQELFNDRLGITFDEVQTSPYANLSFLNTEPMSEGERRIFANYIDETYATFLQRVADARGMSVDDVREIAGGRVWSGRDALSSDVGLVDEVGTLQDAIDMAGKAAGLGDGPFRTRILPRPKTFFEKLNSQLSGQSARLWMEWSLTDFEKRLLEQRNQIRDLIETSGTAQTRLPVQINVQ